MRLATIAAACVLFSAPLAVEAQQPGKVYRVGILTNKASDPYTASATRSSTPDPSTSKPHYAKPKATRPSS